MSRSSIHLKLSTLSGYCSDRDFKPKPRKKKWWQDYGSTKQTKKK